MTDDLPAQPRGEQPGVWTSLRAPDGSLLPGDVWLQAGECADVTRMAVRSILSDDASRAFKLAALDQVLATADVLHEVLSRYLGVSQAERRQPHRLIELSAEPPEP